MPMKSYAVDDFDAIRKRLMKITTPPFKPGVSAAGNHCDYCVKPPDEECPDPCYIAYKNKYGISPQEREE